jgi:RecT family
MTNLVPVNDMKSMAQAIVKSGFYGFKSEDQVMAIMAVAQAENKHPATVVQEYDIIQGRPALKSQAILARFQLAGGKVEYNTYTDEKVEMTFSHLAGGTLTLAWTLKQAHDIGLAKKDNWKNYPRAMLAARVVSEGVRRVYPACILGHYAVEEMMDFDKPFNKEPVQVLQVESIEEEDTTGKFPLYIPDGDGGRKVHMWCEENDWPDAYMDLTNRISDSKKLSDEEKTSRLMQLSSVNKDILEQM